jgi:hypothetical protein
MEIKYVCSLGSVCHFSQILKNNYYIRCVNRFRQLLQYDEAKLFIMILVNIDSVDEKLKNNIIDFNNKFSKYTKNYTLLVIFHIQNKQNNHHTFTHYDNIDFLEFEAFSNSNGIKFNDSNDNDYLNQIINNTYNFKIYQGE